ncbi:ferritin family protein [candidate division KSB1 bacterium]
MAFLLSSIIDVAVKLEQEGAEYYTELARIAKNTKTQLIFMQFADEERKHEDFFINLKRNDRFIDYEIEDEEIEKILEETEPEDILPDSPEDIVKKLHPLNAIKLGIKSEKRTVKFYKLLSKKLKDPEIRKILATLIEEEQRHVNDLTDLHKDKTFEF